MLNRIHNHFKLVLFLKCTCYKITKISPNSYRNRLVKRVYHKNVDVHKLINYHQIIATVHSGRDLQIKQWIVYSVD